MRKQFSRWLEEHMSGEERALFITGDLGFMAFEKVQERFGERFVNAGVSEQHMITMAAALASEGLAPICYSIASFAVFRPAEQIRLDVCLHNMNVKIVGNGGGYGYGVMGSTHHALEDLGHMSSYQNMKCYVPICDEDTTAACAAMVSREGPGYLRLGLGALPAEFSLPAFAPIRRHKTRSPERKRGWTILGIGPCTLRAATADADIFSVSELPLAYLSEDFLESVAATQKLLILEDHVERSGLAEHVALHLLKKGLAPRLELRSAEGYFDGLHGSQSFHEAQNGLDPESILRAISEEK